MAGVRAKVNRDVLIWARKSAKLEPDQAAKKVRVKPEQLESWEAGDARPTIRQLRELGRVYKRPIAVFYLSEPPVDFHAMHDYRRLPGQVAGLQSSALSYEIRRGWTRREVAIELFEEVEGELPVFSHRATIGEEPDHVAERLRAQLNVELSEQFHWKPGRDTFNAWRDAVESAGVLVLQMTSVEVSESRGFSISETPLPTIVVNRKDTWGGRAFTIMHELAHVVLRQGGLCDLNDYAARAPEELQTEVYCNQVAAATLVPTGSLLSDPSLQQSRGRVDWPDEVIEYLSRRYGVSQEVIVRRFLTLERTTAAFYQSKREQYREEYEANRERELRNLRESEGGPSPAALAYSSAGPTFTRLVLRGYQNDRITASSVADFLEVRLKHLPKIEGYAFPGGVR